jgi:hypothetical protein
MVVEWASGLIDYKIYGGNGSYPGNSLDPDRNGSGLGGVGDGTSGRIVALYNFLQIVPIASSRSKPSSDGGQVIDVVFDSPVALDSASLEVTDGTGAAVTADDQALELISSDALHRYQVRWIPEEADSLVGAQTIKVRGSRAGATFSSAAYAIAHLGESLDPNTSTANPAR